MRFHSISGQRSQSVSSPETSLGALLKFDKRKGLREKAADIIWSFRSSELPRSQQWMPPQCGEDSLRQKIRLLICYSHVFLSNIEWSRFTLSNKPIQIDSVRSRDVLQVWASSFFDHLNHCRSVFEQVELGWVWTVGNVGWYVVNWLNKKLLSECEWDGMTLSPVWRSKFPMAGLLDSLSKTHSPNWRACDPSTRKPAPGQKIRLCTAVRNCGLLHPRSWNKRVWSKYAQ